MNTGLRPTPIDPRDKHFRFDRIFGATAVFPAEYDADAGMTMPDQNADARDTECTAYTIVDIGTDQDRELYSADYQYMKTLQVMGVPPDFEGANARTAFKMPVAFGLLKKALEPKEMKKSSQAWAAQPSRWPLELDALAVKKPAYLPIYPSGQDWFDAIRSALTLGKKEKRTVGIATPWYAEFTDAERGVLPEDAATLTNWHMYKVSGWTAKHVNGDLIRGGEVFLKVKPWLGKKRGDKGWYYLSRPLAAKLLKQWGTYAATMRDVPEDTIEERKAREVTLLETVIALMQNLIIELRYKLRI